VRYTWRTKPYAHQQRAVKFALSRFKEGGHPAFLMEPRTGKTKATIDTLSILSIRDGLNKVVIVCPNRVIGTWIEEFARHCPIVYQITVWDKDARKQPLPPANGRFDLNVILVNYEAFATPGASLGKDPRTGRIKRSKTRGGRWSTRKNLRKWIGDDQAACVLDESHKIKSPSGRTSMMLVSMRDNFSHRFLLTGTPVTKAKRAHDIFMQWKFLNPETFADWHTAEDFKNATGRWTDANGFPQWLSEKKPGMDKLKAGLHQDGLVVRREDCFDLPPVQDDVRRIRLGPSGKVYDDMAEEMVALLKTGEVAEASIPLVVTLRLLQITSGFVGVRETVMVRGEPKLIARPVRVGFEKLNALEDIIKEEIIEREEKVIIPARFNFDMDAIVALGKAYRIPTFQLRGGIKPAEADESRRKFNRMDGPALFVVQPQAASLGIDLRSANRTIWYSLTPSWVDYTQTCDRNALHAASRIMTYLIAEGTVDEAQLETLEMDGNLSRELLRKPEKLLRKRR
jgi:SNF2 family DNA or RNA helicase